MLRSVVSMASLLEPRGTVNLLGHCLIVEDRRENEGSDILGSFESDVEIQPRERTTTWVAAAMRWSFFASCLV